jgi:transcriptional regulator with XRE-family HTH domain
MPKTTSRSPNKTSAKAGTSPAQPNGRRPNGPQIGNVIRNLRRQRGLSLREVAERAQLSASFLGAVERGESDISVGRLSLIAEVLGHDLASLLGYSLRQSSPRFIRPDEQVRMRRGKGIELTAMRIPSTNLELLLATLPPHSQDRPVTHAGVDILYVLEGNLVLRLDDTDYPMTAGECVVWPSSHEHAIRNDSDQPARAIGLVTETVY